MTRTIPKFLISCVLLVVSLYACKDDDSNFEPIYDVPEDIQPIVDAFIAEAASRGISLNIDNLIIEYDDDIGLSCGTCNSNDTSANIQKVIRIRTEIAFCYNNSQQLETLIFHEMGHCVLGRLHDDSTLPNGDPKSIMMQNNLSMYSPCDYAIGGDGECNNLDKRDYYIDELFNENTPTPDWTSE